MIEYFFGFISLYSLYFRFISSGVGVQSLKAYILGSQHGSQSVAFYPISLDVVLKLLHLVVFSVSLPCLKPSKLTRKQSNGSPSLCLLFSNFIID